MTKSNPISPRAQRQGSEGRIRDPYAGYTGPGPGLPAVRVKRTGPPVVVYDGTHVRKQLGDQPDSVLDDDS